MSMVHDFNEQLAWSELQRYNQMWKRAFRQAFPKMNGAVYCGEDGEHQRAGIDWLVTEWTAKVHKIDAKSRRKDYGDILLEHWSSWERKIPGWARKGLLAEWIAYGIIPRRVAYILPVTQLQAAYESNWKEWLEKYNPVHTFVYRGVEKRTRWKCAKNKGYTTISMAVPAPVLLDAIRDCMVVDLVA